MDFITGLPILIDWKRDIYNPILVIIDWLTKMFYYKPVKIMFDAYVLAKVIINVVVRDYGFLDSIVTNKSLLFISKFGHCSIIFLASNRDFLPHFTFKLTVKRNDQIA